MIVRRLWMTGAGCALMLVAAFAAEDDQLLATVDRPAILTVEPTKAFGSTVADQPAPRVVVHVTGYEPPQEGGIRGVVKVRRPDGSKQEIGTFGVLPDAAFKADSLHARRYGFPLPKELASGPVKLKVEVVPDKPRATGVGAQLEIGRAEVQ